MYPSRLFFTMNVGICLIRQKSIAPAWVNMGKYVIIDVNIKNFAIVTKTENSYFDENYD